MAKSGNKWLGVAICGFMWLKVVLCRPFWMSEIHFRSHFWPLQIDTQLFLAISDRLAILDFLNSLSIAILAISDGYRILLGFFRRPFWMSENHFRSHFWPFLIDRQYWMSKIHFRWHFWPYRFIFLNFGQNGRRRPFWMSENNFRSQFLPFQIDTQLFFWDFF